ncbi:MAG: DsbA family protein [Chloroflexi bacterium]|nr:DsbA family protein [Chloroflexota bacterium]
MPRLTLPVDPARDHTRGPDDAPVTLLEYGDFECPHCKAAAPIIQDVLAELGDEVRFVYRHFPLTRTHPNAMQAAVAAEAAGAQGMFWEMHDMLFDNQDDLSVEALKGYGEKIGIPDMDRYRAALEDGHHLDKIEEDFRTGTMSGVNGTPTLYINGERFQVSWDKADLLGALQEAAG